MKTLIAVLGTLSFLCGALYLKFGIQPFCRSYAHARSMPSARDYWIEFEEGDAGRIRHKFGRSWPLRCRDGRPDLQYFGEGASLWIVNVPGINQEFLIIDTCSGAYSFHRLLYRVEGKGNLVPVMEFGTVAEIQGDREINVLDATFEDIDGDGIPELKECHREWIIDDQGTVLNNWAIRTIYFVWNGHSFVPTFQQLEDGDRGPLLPLNRHP